MGGRNELTNNSGLRQAYITFYTGEMEALWKERSSSLEMVQAIQRSLLNNPVKVEADTPVDVEKPVEAEKQEVADKQITDKIVRLSTRNAFLKSGEVQCAQTQEELAQLQKYQHVLLKLSGEKEEQVEEPQSEVGELNAFYRKQLGTQDTHNEQQQKRRRHPAEG
ncbi:hypothetical protein BBJ28_00020641 [Nothophytophthora sp. Chile5]|nr:hypothetical protein BBJ28_00020641 [Nothophytophthora sp. Chile5]